MQTWTEKDFDELGWHDCHVHGFFVAETEHGRANLTLDIDFITAWEKGEGNSLCFRVAPATLVFFDIHELSVEISYRWYAITPFSISGIERELQVNQAGFREWLYRLPVNCPTGQIAFRGDRFVQTLRAEAVRSDSQCLSAAERAPFGA
jgi:hypothetical protein